MTLHIVGFPHTRTTPEFSWCAYTSKALKLCRMLSSHDLVLYAAEGSEDAAAEVVEVLTEQERLRLFGPDDPNRLPAWPSPFEWELFNKRAGAAIRARVEPHDLVLLMAGWSQKPIADALPDLLCIEPGVGYEGIFTHCAFESYAWMHHLYGLKGWRDGRWYDTVIPNFFDPADFPHLNQGRGDYLLFMGRIVKRKGLHVAADIARDLGMRLLVAGAGGKQEGDRIVADEVTVSGSHLEYVGPVGVEQRAELMAGARALLCPTEYVEPFGGVAVEAMMCGTSVVATDWGAFVETVQEGVSGYRFRTLAEGCEAVEKAVLLNPTRVREYAMVNYSLESVRPLYERWFARLGTLWGEGWYERRAA